jgi:hypothetical protein
MAAMFTCITTGEHGDHTVSKRIIESGKVGRDFLEGFLRRLQRLCRQSLLLCRGRRCLLLPAAAAAASAATATAAASAAAAEAQDVDTQRKARLGLRQ